MKFIAASFAVWVVIVPLLVASSLIFQALDATFSQTTLEILSLAIVLAVTAAVSTNNNTRGEKR
jgi:hypothetical protein